MNFDKESKSGIKKFFFWVGEGGKGGRGGGVWSRRVQAA